MYVYKFCVCIYIYICRSLSIQRCHLMNSHYVLPFWRVLLYPLRQCLDPQRMGMQSMTNWWVLSKMLYVQSHYPLWLYHIHCFKGVNQLLTKLCPSPVNGFIWARTWKGNELNWTLNGCIKYTQGPTPMVYHIIVLQGWLFRTQTWLTGESLVYFHRFPN